MAIGRPRFEFALKNLKSSDWQHFEELSSSFLAADYPNLRTTAATSGDKGRDAELFSSNFAKVMFQYSVQEDWAGKIQDSLATLKKNFPEFGTLVFMTNRQVGAKGDKLRTTFRKDGKNLDVRDNSWFLDRFTLDDHRMRAAEGFATIAADPILRTAAERPGSALVGQEARTALLYLEMQATDEDGKKGLTKSCFETLVRCALRNTDADTAMTPAEIEDYIQRLLPRHTSLQLRPFIAAAIKRLSRQAIKAHKSPERYHISFEEAATTKDKYAAIALLNASFQDDVEDVLMAKDVSAAAKLQEYSALVRNAIEMYFYRLGEEFAQSLVADSDLKMHHDLMRSIVDEIVPAGRFGQGTISDLIYASVLELLATPSSSTVELLKLLSTSYTLFSFLSEVPDVQKATKRLFENATIWIDTTALLPVVAEQAFTEDKRPFTNMYLQLRRAGTKLVVTEGVLEEVEAHLNKCRSFAYATRWDGSVPYIYAQFSISGRQKGQFSSWMENFIGNHRPIDDLADFFNETAKINREEVPPLDTLPAEVVTAVRQYWQEVHDRRRGKEEGFNMFGHRLAQHDADNYLAALALRVKGTNATDFGFTSWYLTLDTAAWKLKAQIASDISTMIGHAPVISLDFLLRYLAFGPRRDQVDSSGNDWARIFTETVFVEVPSDLVDIATAVRQANIGRSERIIQRRIRDELDKQRMRSGVAQKAGLEGAEAAFLGEL